MFSWSEHIKIYATEFIHPLALTKALHHFRRILVIAYIVKMTELRENCIISNRQKMRLEKWTNFHLYRPDISYDPDRLGNG
jgi:hypothetical protein